VCNIIFGKKIQTSQCHLGQPKNFNHHPMVGGCWMVTQKIPIRHIGIVQWWLNVFSRQEREHVICFWKFFINDFSKNIWHAPFYGNRKVGNRIFSIVARSICLQLPFLMKDARVLIKILMCQLQNDYIISILTTLLCTIGKPLMCKGPLMHGFIMFKFVVQKLFNILKN